MTLSRPRFGPACTFCEDATGSCAHLLLEVDLWDQEVRAGPLAQAMKKRWCGYADFHDETIEDVSMLDLFLFALEPVSVVADDVVEKEEDPMPGLSWTIRRYLVKGDRAAAVARAIRLFDGTEKAPAAPRRRARAALKKRRKRAG